MQPSLTVEYLASQRLSEDFVQRFWPKVDKNGPIPSHCPELGPCWLWTAYRDEHGRGQIGRGAGRKRGHIRSHRAVWILTFGPIPDGLEVCHKCDNTSCVNPQHLFTGTHHDNMIDMIKKGRWLTKTGKLFCATGEHHPHVRFSDQQVEEMRRLRREGKMLKEIAPLFNTCNQTIWSIVAMKSRIV